MDPKVIKLWVEIVSGILTLIAGLLAALWAYVKFILERGLLPPSQFDIECRVVGQQQQTTILEIILRLKNLGGSTLIAGNVRVDVRLLDAADESWLFDDPNQLAFGRLRFPHSLRELLEPERSISGTSPPEIAKATEPPAER